MKFTLYAVCSPDIEMLKIAKQVVFTSDIGYLISFAHWSVEKARWASEHLSGIPCMADSGSFSAYMSERDLFIKNSMWDLKDFYENCPATILIEPDVLEVKQPLGKLTGTLRAIKLRRILDSTRVPHLTRALQGENTDERIAYLNFLNEGTKCKAQRLAIGGIARKDLEQSMILDTASKLKGECKKIHLLGRTSHEALDYAFALFGEGYGYEEVSVDSESWSQSVYNARKIWNYDSAAKKLEEVDFSNKTLGTKDKMKLEQFEAGKQKLRKCDCPICDSVWFNLDNGRPRKLDWLGELSQRQIDSEYDKLFVKRGKLHNLYQQRLFVQDRIKSLRANNASPKLTLSRKPSPS